MRTIVGQGDPSTGTRRPTVGAMTTTGRTIPPAARKRAAAARARRSWCAGAGAAAGIRARGELTVHGRPITGPGARFTADREIGREFAIGSAVTWRRHRRRSTKCRCDATRRCRPDRDREDPRGGEQSRRRDPEPKAVEIDTITVRTSIEGPGAGPQDGDTGRDGPRNTRAFGPAALDRAQGRQKRSTAQCRMERDTQAVRTIKGDARVAGPRLPHARAIWSGPRPPITREVALLIPGRGPRRSSAPIDRHVRISRAQRPRQRASLSALGIVEFKRGEFVLDRTLPGTARRVRGGEDRHRNLSRISTTRAVRGRRARSLRCSSAKSKGGAKALIRERALARAAALCRVQSQAAAGIRRRRVEAPAEHGLRQAPRCAAEIRSAGRRTTGEGMKQRPGKPEAESPVSSVDAVIGPGREGARRRIPGATCPSAAGRCCAQTCCTHQRDAGRGPAPDCPKCCSPGRNFAPRYATYSRRPRGGRVGQDCGQRARATATRLSVRL